MNLYLPFLFLSDYSSGTGTSMACVKGTTRPPFTLRVPAAEVSEHPLDTLEDLPQENEVYPALGPALADVSTTPVVGDDDGSDDESKVEGARTLDYCPILETTYNTTRPILEIIESIVTLVKDIDLAFPNLVL